MNPKANTLLGRIWGIPIGLDWSWFPIFGLVTWPLASGYLPDEYPDLPAWALWSLGALIAVLFFGSVLAHELAHAWVALRNGIPVKEITLHIFGGVAYLDREVRTAGAEFRIAIIGPDSASRSDCSPEDNRCSRSLLPGSKVSKGRRDVAVPWPTRKRESARQ